MKKIILLFILLSLQTIAQNNAHCNIRQISSSTVAPLDSAWIGIEVNDDYPNSLTDTAWLYIDSPTCSLVLIYHECYDKLLNHTKKYFYNGDSLIKISFKVPYICSDQGRYISKDSKVPVFINGLATGISQYDYTDAIVKTEYYNLIGQEMNIPQGLCIQVTVYQSGRIIKSKVLKLEI